jgi:hypothetical protein
MRRLLAIVLTLAAVPFFASYRNGYRDHRGHGRTVSISTDDDNEAVTRCSQIDVRYDGDRVPVIEQSVPVSGVRTLRVRPPQNGGVRVVGWDQATYSVTACKATFIGRDARDITIEFRGDELTANVPDDTDAVVYFLVRTPRNASLDLEAYNGELGVQDFNGKLTAHTTNGPISLKQVSGTVDADAQNGPISLSGGSGVVKLEAQNGPISIKLDGASWANGSLDARTQNGPMSLKLPSDYRSGVVVQSDGHGPMSCHAEACRQAHRTWDDDAPRRIELGSGTTAVRLSTVNGPVSVRER